MISFVFIAAFAPETKGRPLEDIRRYWENGGSWPEGGRRMRRARGREWPPRWPSSPSGWPA